MRFFILNAIWNYSFWLNAKKIYKIVHYKHNENYTTDPYLFVVPTHDFESKRRFVGYMYKGQIYLDNPGRPIDLEEWRNLRKKKLL